MLIPPCRRVNDRDDSGVACYIDFDGKINTYEAIGFIARCPSGSTARFPKLGKVRILTVSPANR
jgi:hypothetical protein